LEIHIHKRQVSFLDIKTVKCKRGISNLLIDKLHHLFLLLKHHFTLIRWK